MQIGTNHFTVVKTKFFENTVRGTFLVRYFKYRFAVERVIDTSVRVNSKSASQVRRRIVVIRIKIHFFKVVAQIFIFLKFLTIVKNYLCVQMLKLSC